MHDVILWSRSVMGVLFGERYLVQLNIIDKTKRVELNGESRVTILFNMELFGSDTVNSIAQLLGVDTSQEWKSVDNSLESFND